MDLGCIDMGCVEKQKKGSPKESVTSAEKDDSPKESLTSASRLGGKSNRAKDALRSSLNALNKLTSQITKPPHRNSPTNWFPRKKVEPYLKRKIKMLQEVHGMQSTLDETLGDSHPHYSRVLREKMAIIEAAEKAVEARKAAMVEASWCRILQAARIESKEAETQLAKAENCASEALEAAREVGVTMNEIPDCVQIHYKTETPMSSVPTTFETAFDVDKQVARAVKAAFIKLANCPSINKDEFKELLAKISEHPDTEENHHELSDFTSESECDAILEHDVEEGSSNCEQDSSFGNKKLPRKQKKRQELDKFSMENMIEMMLERLRCLKEEELASLATIVATCGLNAALAQSENKKRYDDLSSARENHCPKGSNRTSSIGGRNARNSISAEAELPSLDKFLVKKLTRLEREVLEAKNARKNESKGGNEVKKLNDGTDFGKEFEEVRNSIDELSETNNKKSQTGLMLGAKQEVPSLDKFLVKRLTRLEREVQEARNNNYESGRITNSTEKENVDMNRAVGRDNGNYESLDKVLVKHVTRLEKEKMELSAGKEENETKLKRKECNRDSDCGEGSLDQVLVKHKSRLEKEKMAAAVSGGDDHKQEDGSVRYSVSRRQAREKELQDAWGGLSLGAMRPHVSRLQRDKAAWIKAEEEERKRAKEVV